MFFQRTERWWLWTWAWPTGTIPSVNGQRWLALTNNASLTATSPLPRYGKSVLHVLSLNSLQICKVYMKCLYIAVTHRDATILILFEKWHVARASTVSHSPAVLLCIFPQTIDNEGRHYECDLLPLMEVGSVAHKYYLLNMRLPVNERKKINVGIGEIKDIQVVVSRLQRCTNTFL